MLPNFCNSRKVLLLVEQEKAYTVLINTATAHAVTMAHSVPGRLNFLFKIFFPSKHPLFHEYS